MDEARFTKRENENYYRHTSSFRYRLIKMALPLLLKVAYKHPHAFKSMVCESKPEGCLVVVLFTRFVLQRECEVFILSVQSCTKSVPFYRNVIIPVFILLELALLASY